MQRSGDARGDCLIVCPPYPYIVLSSGVRWPLLYVTSFSRLQTNVLAKVYWHNMHITLHALSLLVIVQRVTVISVRLVDAVASTKLEIGHYLGQIFSFWATCSATITFEWGSVLPSTAKALLRLFCLFFASDGKADTAFKWTGIIWQFE